MLEVPESLLFQAQKYSPKRRQFYHLLQRRDVNFWEHLECDRLIITILIEASIMRPFRHMRPGSTPQQYPTLNSYPCHAPWKFIFTLYSQLELDHPQATAGILNYGARAGPVAPFHPRRAQVATCGGGPLINMRAFKG